MANSWSPELGEELGGSSRSGYLLTHQPADDLGRGSVFGCGLDTEPVGGKIVYEDNVALMLCEEAAFAVTGQLWYMGRPVFIQGIVFFVSQIRHKFLLWVEQRQQCVPAFYDDTHISYILAQDRRGGNRKRNGGVGIKKGGPV
jgi:hypothetical protein